VNAVERYLLALTLLMFTCCSLAISYELCHLTAR
jgi:hypothetical protein